MGGDNSCSNDLKMAVERWNEKNKDFCIILNEEEEEVDGSNTDENSDSESEDGSSTKWTDRALMEEFGSITCIEVEEKRDGYIIDWIQRIRARYGPDDSHWSPWREVGPLAANPRAPRKLELENRSLCGFSYNGNGTLFSFATINMQGEIEEAGSHNPHSSLSLSVGPPAPIAPSYLSGCEEEYKYSVCFNYL